MLCRARTRESVSVSIGCERAGERRQLNIYEDTERSMDIPSGGDDPPGYDSCLPPPEVLLTTPRVTGANASYSTYPTTQMYVGPVRVAESHVNTAAGCETPSTECNWRNGGNWAVGASTNSCTLVPSFGISGSQFCFEGHSQLCVQASQTRLDQWPCRLDTARQGSMGVMNPQVKAKDSDVGARLRVKESAPIGSLSLGAGVGGLLIRKTAAKSDRSRKGKLEPSRNEAKGSTEISSESDKPRVYESCLKTHGSQQSMPHITVPNASLSTCPAAQMYAGPIVISDEHVNTATGFETPSAQCNLLNGGNGTVGASTNNCVLVPSLGTPGPPMFLESQTRSCLEDSQARLGQRPSQWSTALHGSMGVTIPEVKAKESDIGACLNVEECAQTGSLSLGAGAGGLLIRKATAKSDMSRKGKLEPSINNTKTTTEVSSRGDDPPGYDSCLLTTGSQQTMPHISGPNASFSTYPTVQMCVGPIRVTESQVNTVAGFEMPPSQCDLGSGGSRTMGTSTYNCVLIPGIGIPGPCVGVAGLARPCVEASQPVLWQHPGRRDGAVHGSVRVSTSEVKSKEPDIGACLSVEKSAQTGRLSLGAGAGGPQIHQAATKSQGKSKVKLASSGIASQTDAQAREVGGHGSFAGAGRPLTPASGFIFPGAKANLFRH